MLTVFVGQYGVYLKQQVKSLVWIAKGVPAGALAACPLPVFEPRKPAGVLDSEAREHRCLGAKASHALLDVRAA